MTMSNDYINYLNSLIRNGGHMAVYAQAELSKFSEGQERDEHGRWTAGDHEAAAKEHADKAEAFHQAADAARANPNSTFDEKQGPAKAAQLHELAAVMHGNAAQALSRAESDPSARAMASYLSSEAVKASEKANAGSSDGKSDGDAKSPAEETRLSQIQERAGVDRPTAIAIQEHIDDYYPPNYSEMTDKEWNDTIDIAAKTYTQFG